MRAYLLSHDGQSRPIFRLMRGVDDKGGIPMVDRSRSVSLQIMLSAAELTALDNFRFKARMPSRAAAVRELLKRGLAAEGLDLAGSAGVIGKRLATRPTK